MAVHAVESAFTVMGYTLTEVDASHGVVRTAPRTIRACSGGVLYASALDHEIAWWMLCSPARRGVEVKAVPQAFRCRAPVPNYLFAAEIMAPTFERLWTELDAVMVGDRTRNLR